MKGFGSIIALCMLLSMFSTVYANNSWRGPERDGKYPCDNLLQQWPANGPRMVWAFENLGIGFSSPVLANGRIYVNGMVDGIGYLFILSKSGELINRFPYGRELTYNYPGTRSTPVIIGNVMYIATSYGVLVALDTNTGKIRWSKDLFNDLDGRSMHWGFTENLVIDGDLIFVSPGGVQHNIVAINRHTGDIEWSSRASGGTSAYNSPILINHNGRRILVAMMQSDVVGLDAQTGRLLWSHPYQSQRGIHPNTPIYYDGSVYAFSGYGKGAVKLRISPDGNSVTEAWSNITVDTQMGGAVLHNGYIYASGHRNRRWFVVDWDTGAISHESRDIDVGNIIYADGMLYAYSERGELALIKPRPGGFDIVSRVNIELGSEQHWAHLVIDEGILYVRRGNALMAFDIRNR